MQDDFPQHMPSYTPASQPLTMTHAFFIKVFTFHAVKSIGIGKNFSAPCFTFTSPMSHSKAK